MSPEGLLLAGLVLLLASVTWGLLRLIKWLRMSPGRYFYFQLFSPVFMLGIGLLCVLAPGEAKIPLWLIGIAFLLYGAFSIAALLAWRFQWKWLFSPLGRPKDVLRCSFCNKSQRDVLKLIAGPNVFICDECVGICQNILLETPPTPEPPPPDPSLPVN